MPPKPPSTQSLAAMAQQTPSSTQLLQTVLNTPHLPTVVKALQPFALMKLIQHVGVEECAELLEHVSAAQLSVVLDEDLWRSRRVGEPESFDMAQAVRWMRVWREIGPDHVVETLEGLGREFLATLVIHFADVHELSGVAWDMLNLDGFGSILENQDQPFRHLYGDYVLDARIRDTDLWDLFESTLDAVAETAPDFLASTLGLCCNRSHQDECDDESRGRERVNEIEEILRDNLAKDRELRRRRFGFLDPEQARDMLHRCRQLCPPDEVRHFLMERFLWARAENNAQTQDEEETSSELPQDSPAGAVESARTLEAVLFAMEAPQTLPLALPEGTEQTALRPIHGAMRIAVLAGTDAAELQSDLAGLSNLLYSGANIIGKKMDRTRAFDAVLAAAELGLKVQGSEAYLPEGGVIAAFQQGLAKLHQEIALQIALGLDDLVRSRHPDHAFLHETWVKASLNREPNRRQFHRLLRDGRFLDAYRYLVSIKEALPPSLSFPLRCLMSEYPVLPAVLGNGDYITKNHREWRFFTSPDDFSQVRTFIKALPEMI